MYAIHQEGNQAWLYDSLTSIFDAYYDLEETEKDYKVFHGRVRLKRSYSKEWKPEEIKKDFIKTNKDLKIYKMERLYG